MHIGLMQYSLQISNCNNNAWQTKPPVALALLFSVCGPKYTKLRHRRHNAMITFKLSTITYNCLHGLAPSYLPAYMTDVCISVSTVVGRWQLPYILCTLVVGTQTDVGLNKIGVSTLDPAITLGFATHSSYNCFTNVLLNWTYSKFRYILSQPLAILEAERSIFTLSQSTKRSSIITGCAVTHNCCNGWPAISMEDAKIRPLLYP